MITRENIDGFIRHLYWKRKQQIAPEELIQKWKALSNEEIQTTLTELFNSWGYSEQQASDEIRQFIAQNTTPTEGASTSGSAAAESGKTKTTSQTPPSVSTKKSNSKLRLIALLAVILPLLYVGVQYYKFINLSQVYAITENIVVRDENNMQVAQLDLTVPTTATKYPSASSLRVLDDQLYERAIDSTNKLRKHRLVILPNTTFKEYLLNNYTPCYVNANLVVEDESEFNRYKTAFRGLSYKQAALLELKYRKVIVKCIQQDPSFDDRYVQASCDNDTKSSYLPFVTRELTENARHEVIARLDNGKYYKFVGDLRANSYAKPVPIGYVPTPITDDEFLVGDVLFKYNARSNKVSLFTCDKKNMNFTSELATDNSISHFKEVEIIVPPAPQPTSLPDSTVDATQIIEKAGRDIIDNTIDAISDGIDRIIK